LAEKKEREEGGDPRTPFVSFLQISFVPTWWQASNLREKKKAPKGEGRGRGGGVAGHAGICIFSSSTGPCCGSHRRKRRVSEKGKKKGKRVWLVVESNYFPPLPVHHQGGWGQGLPAHLSFPEAEEGEGGRRRGGGKRQKFPGPQAAYRPLDLFAFHPHLIFFLGALAKKKKREKEKRERRTRKSVRGTATILMRYAAAPRD